MLSVYVYVIKIVFMLLILSAESKDNACYSDGECGDDALLKLIRQGCQKDLSNLKCALEKAREIDQWLKRNNQFNILIVGKMGTGKTTFIKGLTEKWMPDENNLLPHTVNVTPYFYEYEQMKLQLFDTPGLMDNLSSSNDYSYLQDMIKNSYSPDLIIFTVKMDDAELRSEDTDTIKAVSQAFGWKCWKNAMFILTFANKVVKIDARPDSPENKIYFNKERDHIKMQIIKTLQANNVHDKVIDNIPIVPIGLIKQTQIPSDEIRESWVERFFRDFDRILNVQREETESKPPVVKIKKTSPKCPPQKKCISSGWLGGWCTCTLAR